MITNKFFLLALLSLLIIHLVSGKSSAKQAWTVAARDDQESETENAPEQTTQYGEDKLTTTTKAEELLTPIVDSVKIKSRVQFRYATTNIRTRVTNPADQAQTLGFVLSLPESAFITAFQIESDGILYHASVKKRKEAELEYLSALEQGFTAAHISQSERDQSRFGIAVNLKPKSKLGLNITYEELLPRRKGIYQQVISLRPEQMSAKYIKFELYVIEASNITKMSLEGMGINLNLKNNTEIKNDASGEVKLISPTGVYAKLISQNGLESQENQKIVMEYDIDRSQPEILLMDGYFVHFMPAPQVATSLPKHVIFVLDTSASMWGVKIKQLREAMSSILSKLKSEDYFTIITFNSEVKLWTPQKAEVVGLTKYRVVHEASANLIAQAKEYITTIEADGGTNIFEALRQGLQVAAKKEKGGHDIVQPIVFFLSDGVPTVGELSLLRILGSARAINTEIKASIFSLGFGDNAKFRFLQKLSVQNHGWARRIYESADAVLQLENVFEEIQAPALANATFVYVQKVEHVTKKKFTGIFIGGEAVVAGHLPAEEVTLVGEVMATGKQGIEIFTQRSQELRAPPGETGVLERLWAYLTIRQELDLESNDIVNNSVEREERALEIALRYGFVTPVTSLLVTIPDVEGRNVSLITSPLTIGEEVGENLNDQEMTNNHKSDMKPFFKPLPVGPFSDTFKNKNNFSNEENHKNKKNLSLSDVVWLPERESSDGMHLIIEDADGHLEEYYLKNINKNSTDSELMEGEKCATPLNESGKCLPLYRCVQNAFASDYDIFLKYFCSRPDKIAGVCCPETL